MQVCLASNLGQDLGICSQKSRNPGKFPENPDIPGLRKKVRGRHPYVPNVPARGPSVCPQKSRSTLLVSPEINPCGRAFLCLTAMKKQPKCKTCLARITLGGGGRFCPPSRIFAKSEKPKQISTRNIQYHIRHQFRLPSKSH